jgi:uncharacterized repeat protein (TIGR01451 family)
VANGSNGAAGTLTFTVPATAVRNTFARFRISTAAGCAPGGLAPDGEVEDYVATIIAYDLGDLPNGVGAALYPTLRANNGARHEIVPNLRLGATVDAEADGQPTTGANGDDLAGPVPDDEDGVTFDPLNLGSPGRASVSVFNNTGAVATLCAYVDWNNDGDFNDSYTITQPGGGTTSETLTQTFASGAAAQNLVLQLGIVPPPGTVGVPPTGAVLIPYARFRLTTTPGFVCAGGAGNPPAGIPPNGEVEDYRIGSTTGTGLMALGNLVFEDRNNNCVVDAGEPGVAGVPVRAFRDSNNDGTPDGAAVATQPTDASGNYLFTALVPDHYVVEIERPSIFLGSTGSGLVYAPTGPCEPAADPDDNIDNLDDGSSAGTTIIRALPITLEPKVEPGPPDSNTNPTVDFGLLRHFDLALRKELSPGQPQIVQPNAVVNYTITVTNEGAIAATAIVISDRIPVGMVLQDTAWTAGPGNTARRTISGPLLPGASTSVTLALRITNVGFGQFINFAQIASAADDGGNPVRDIDSIPDDGENDQDDNDSVTVFVPIGVPANAAWAMLLLALAMLGLGAAAMRRRAAA